ncbi:MAG TPA: sulfotransferase [Anaerolineales bacterium]|nr:sulfotransferase [Anaerolineales bacterium]
MQAEKIPYVFIMGLAHCGSTLLTFLVNAHPEIASVGEIERLRLFIPDSWSRKTDGCSCGRSFYACPFWNRALAGFAARGHGFDKIDYFNYTPPQKQIADEKLKAFVEAVLDVTGKRVFLDASKQPALIEPLFANPYLDVRVINLYRDARASINAWLKDLNPEASHLSARANRLENVLFRTFHAWRVIRSWRQKERERQAVLASLPVERVLSVKYETLAAAPRETMEKIFAFLGVEAGQGTVEGFKSSVEHHIIGNPMRISGQERIVVDESWRTEMQANTLHLFRLLGGERLNREMGYDND